VLYSHLYPPPPPFTERSPDVGVPPEVERVVMRCLAKSPDDRPQTALELSQEFLAAAGVVTSPSTSGFFLPTGPDHAPPAEPPRPSKPGVTALPGSGTHSLASPLPYETPYPASRWKVARASQRLRDPVSLVFLMLLLVGLGAAALWLVRPWKPSLILPEGYRAEDSRDLVGEWPRVLVRLRDGTRFIRIEGGPFKMGNFEPSASDSDEDAPAHPVRLSDYYLQQLEVTNGEMEAYFQAHNIAFKDRPERWRKAVEAQKKAGLDPSRYPAVGISHDLAERYARWVGGRLPTEAQWEFAARSRGRDYLYVWGNEPRPSHTLANIGSVGLIGDVPTSTGGMYEKDRTEQGILDLAGNVREWCRDVWEEYRNSVEPLIDPQGPKPPAGNVEYVVRGLSFSGWPDQFRTTRPRRPEKGDLTADQIEQDGTAEDLGFRVAIEWPRNVK